MGAVGNQVGLFEDEGQMRFISNSFPAPLVLLPHQQQSLKPFSNISSSSSSPHHVSDSAALTTDFPHQTLFPSLYPLRHKEHHHHHLHLHHQFSFQRSASNLWAWGDDVGESFPIGKRINGRDDDDDDDDDRHHLRVSAMKMKKMKGRKKVREPRFCFKTMSDVDVLDDGYKWRKYGQKVVKNTHHPRSYYRCTQEKCRVKKRVERLAEDPRMVITTYEGRHVHSPSHDNLEDSTATYLLSAHLNNFFW